MTFPVSHSVLSCDALRELLLQQYHIKNIRQLDYFQAGLNDTYRLSTDRQQYILRAYRTNWRSESDIRCEIDVLNFLHQHQVSVATPITNFQGEYLTPVNAPEGLRYLVLFNYAAGNAPRYENNAEQQAVLYGQTFGKLHKVLNDFTSPHQRFKLDIAYLLEEPLHCTQPFLQHRADDWQYLTQLAKELKQHYLAYSDHFLQTGFCHGDLNTGNVHIEKNHLTLFDFDCCGYGYLAADLGVFLWGSRINKLQEKIWSPFLSAYLKEKSLNDSDIETIPLFAMMRHIWHIGLHAQLSEDRGRHWINDDYFDQQLKLLRSWEKDIL